MDTIREWLGTFGMILVRPLPRTYVSESAKAKGKFPSAVAWMVFYAIVLEINTSLLPQREFSVPYLLIAILLLPLGFLFFVFSLHLVCQRLFARRKDYYAELLYLVVANFVPFIVISCLVGWIPIVRDVAANLALFYPLILTIVALKAIANLKLWQSILAVVLAAILTLFGLVCVGPFLFSVMATVPRLI